MISEAAPRGLQFLFFGLFSIIGKTSSFIGPLVSSAIIDDPDRNNSTMFCFLTALGAVRFLVLILVADLERSSREQEAFLVEEKVRRTKGVEFTEAEAVGVDEDLKD